MNRAACQRRRLSARARRLLTMREFERHRLSMTLRFRLDAQRRPFGTQSLSVPKLALSLLSFAGHLMLHLHLHLRFSIAVGSGHWRRLSGKRPRFPGLGHGGCWALLRQSLALLRRIAIPLRETELLHGRSHAPCILSHLRRNGLRARGLHRDRLLSCLGEWLLSNWPHGSIEARVLWSPIGWRSRLQPLWRWFAMHLGSARNSQRPTLSGDNAVVTSAAPTGGCWWRRIGELLASCSRLVSFADNSFPQGSSLVLLPYKIVFNLKEVSHKIR